MTKTEAALQALAAALSASASLPATRRSTPLDDVLEEMDGETGVSRALVLQDGDADEDTGELSMGRLDDRFAIIHRAELEWTVAARDGAELATIFDEGLEAIATVVEANRTLGGAVEDVDLRDPPKRVLYKIGARPAKTAVIVVTLEFQSSRPF